MAIPVDSVDPLHFASCKSIGLSMEILWLSRMSTRAVDILLPQVTDFSSEARMHERPARMDDGSGSGIRLILSTALSAEPELEREPSKTGT